MKISDYSYNLPPELIADRPPLERGTSRLLALNRQSGQIQDRNYSDVIEYLNSGDVLILNDTKVIRSRLFVTKPNGAQRELIILERHQNNDWHHHQVMYRGSLHQGDELRVSESKNGVITEVNHPHYISVSEILGDGLAIVSSEVDLLTLANQYGTVPLPPYMNRDATPEDIERYQTIFAEHPGSAAAPTASLNMTDEILGKLRAKGVIIKYLTLHVGLGTFLPIRTDNIEDHKMHSEFFTIPIDTIQAIKTAKSSGKRITALGTTVARTLEYSANSIFSRIHSAPGSMRRTSGSPHGLSGEADIFIYPGYKFKLVDTLITNFHAPGSTVLMLTAAFAGWDHLSQAYSHAIDNRYSFLSYGDSMIIT